MNYNDSEVEVALLEGSVSLNRYNSSENLREVIKLKPGQFAVYRKNEHKVAYGSVNVDKYIALTKGIVMFENDPLKKVAQLLGREFNVDILIKDNEIAEYTFTATFVDEPLSQILKLIKLALPVDYKIIRSKKQKDGTFTRTIVLIQKR
jgi:ferric-dicitrate binding protein FerR (iron transport regulator)